MQTLTVPIFDTEGDEIGEEVIPYEEVREFYDTEVERRITVVELQAETKADKESIEAALDLVYGYFKWRYN